jgi:hypothetical protein
VRMSATVERAVLAVKFISFSFSLTSLFLKNAPVQVQILIGY